MTPWLDIDEQVRLRRNRQAVLHRAQVRIVIEQSALERVICDEESHFQQLACLLNPPESTKVQVVPTLTGRHAGIAGPITLLRFDDGPSLARADGRGDGEVFDNQQDVRRAERAFDGIIAAAMSPEQSAEYIAAVMEELER